MKTNLACTGCSREGDAKRARRRRDRHPSYHAVASLLMLQVGRYSVSVELSSLLNGDVHLLGNTTPLSNSGEGRAYRVSFTYLKVNLGLLEPSAHVSSAKLSRPVARSSVNFRRSAASVPPAPADIRFVGYRPSSVVHITKM